MRKWKWGWTRILPILALSLPVFAQYDLVSDVRAQLAQGAFSGADSELRAYKSRQGVTPAYLEALSWMARGASSAGQWDRAVAYANETRTGSEQMLAKRKLDAEPHLPTALGAAYEVLSQAALEQGHPAQAATLLRSALARYGNTSIGARLQKNLNLIVLVGHPAPPLQISQYLGPKPPTLASLKGQAVLLFFWAHWCVDCKAEIPIIARLRQEFSTQGLAVLGPTQFYGYAAQGADATPAQEQPYIEAVRQRYYSSLLDMPVPLSKQNFNAYGASTTPTVVLVDRAGKVAMYHPGAMDYSDLRAAIERALK